MYSFFFPQHMHVQLHRGQHNRLSYAIGTWLRELQELRREGHFVPWSHRRLWRAFASLCRNSRRGCGYKTGICEAADIWLGTLWQGSTINWFSQGCYRVYIGSGAPDCLSGASRKLPQVLSVENFNCCHVKLQFWIRWHAAWKRWFTGNGGNRIRRWFSHYPTGTSCP